MCLKINPKRPENSQFILILVVGSRQISILSNRENQQLIYHNVPLKTCWEGFLHVSESQYIYSKVGSMETDLVLESSSRRLLSTLLHLQPCRLLEKTQCMALVYRYSVTVLGETYTVHRLKEKSASKGGKKQGFAAITV